MSKTKSVKNHRGHPKEFAAIIAAKNQNFVGRNFVFSAINNFLHQYDRGYFTISGDPGSGKSAILAHYVSQNPDIIYYNAELVGKNRVESFLAIICDQLIEMAQDRDIQNIANNFGDATTGGSGFLSLLLQKISDRLAPEQRLIITIDGCDKIDLKNQSPGANIFYLPRYLPEKVYFILARRPFLQDKSGLLIETPAQLFDLAAYPLQNRSDVQEYIRNYLSFQNIVNHHPLLTHIGNDETNFMYVSEILSAITEDIADTNTLPLNLQLYYQNHWERMNLATQKQESVALQVLNILVAQEQPISLARIAEILDEDEYEINVILDKWREFLHLELREGEIYYSFYHYSFRNWFRQQRAIKPIG